MPQMSPLNWLTLMMIFIMIFMWINTMNYFIFNKTCMKTSMHKIKTSLNWKW